ncbi:hypothetical protein [Longimicrobium sp.]|uniref:hypothetical protein n=1 Tax=Longimicrobium sp. TaxID=2029185 RepID=UPI002ED98189
MKMLRGRAVRLACAVMLVAVAGAPAFAQQGMAAAAPLAGPLRSVPYFTSTPLPAVSQVTLSPSLADAGAAGPSKVGQAVLLLGLGIGLTAGGRELESSIGFPGAILRYTGIGVTALGVLSFCGCL